MNHQSSSFWSIDFNQSLINVRWFFFMNDLHVWSYKMNGSDCKIKMWDPALLLLCLRGLFEKRICRAFYSLDLFMSFWLPFSLEVYLNRVLIIFIRSGKEILICLLSRHQMWFPELTQLLLGREIAFEMILITQHWLNRIFLPICIYFVLFLPHWTCSCVVFVLLVSLWWSFDSR